MKKKILEELAQITSAAEYIRKISIYKIHWANEDFLLQVQDRVSNEFYFELNRSERTFIRSLLEENLFITDDKTSWSILIQNKIENAFREESVILFLQNEMEQLEECLAGFYFSCFLKNCKKAAGTNVKKQLQELGHEFLNQYENLIEKKDVMEFQNLDEFWIREDLYRCLSVMTFQELSEYQAFRAYPEKYRIALMTAWCNIVVMKLREEKATPEILVKLTKRVEELKDIGKSKLKKYKNSIWKACGDQLAIRIYCSSHLGLQDYSIWSCYELCDTIFYEKCYQFLKQTAVLEYHRIELISVVGISQKAEANRLAYLLWKQVKLHEGNEEIEIDHIGQFSETDQRLRKPEAEDEDVQELKPEESKEQAEEQKSEPAEESVETFVEAEEIVKAVPTLSYSVRKWGITADDYDY